MAEKNFKEITRIATSAKTIIYVHDTNMATMPQAMAGNVRGLILTTSPVGDFLKCLHTVIEGGLSYEKCLVENLAAGRKVLLTHREGQLVTLLARGLKNKEVGILLELTEGTVKSFLSRLFDKVGTKDRFGLGLLGIANMCRMDGMEEDKVPSIRTLYVPKKQG